MASGKTKVWVISAVILVACVTSWFCLSGSHQDTEITTELRTAPSFALKDHSGASHTLHESQGKIRLVHFWAAWCQPCLQEIPELTEFARHFENEPVEVVAISLDEKWEDAEKVMDSAKLPKNMISLLDTKSKISDLYGTYQFPETYLVNAEGRILAKWIGAQPWSSPKTDTFIRQQIAAIHPK
jgi:peroxiredoxin